MPRDQSSRPSGVILAGGESRRMGRAKALIELDGKPLIRHVIDAVESICSEIIIVANEPTTYTQFGHLVVPDALPGKGSLGGVFSGLQAAHHTSIVALACDMPFVNPDLVQYLVSSISGFDIVIPRARGLSSKTPFNTTRSHTEDAKPFARKSDLHPLHAVYAKSCLPVMRSQIEKGDLRLVGLLQDLRVRVVMPEEVDRFDPRHISFFNVNTPDDLDTARNMRSES